MQEIDNLSEEQIQTLLSVLQKALNNKQEHKPKKRGRPKKNATRDTSKNTMKVITKIDNLSKEEKEYNNEKIDKVSKLLNENRQSVKSERRTAVNMVSVKCKNCGKEYEVPSSFPRINKFVCCRK